jgi:hypothetical protein
MEQQVATEEARLRELEATLANLPSNADVLELTREHQRLKEGLEGVIATWTEQVQALENLQSLQG